LIRYSRACDSCQDFLDQGILQAKKDPEPRVPIYWLIEVITSNVKTKGQIMIYKTLQRKLNIEKHEPHQESGMNTDVPEEQAVPIPIVARIVYLKILSIVFHCTYDNQDIPSVHIRD
jgi:hypothetical protein